ncbi:hypothetical protein [Nocardia gipuzkoensis]
MEPLSCYIYGEFASQNDEYLVFVLVPVQRSGSPPAAGVSCDGGSTSGLIRSGVELNQCAVMPDRAIQGIL